jgi:SAM-dependent methyltransferase
VCIEQDDTLLKRIRPFAQRIHNLQEVDLEQKADLVFSANVLEHIEDDVSILRALSKCLKEGGTLAIYVPAMPMLWTAMDNNVGHFRRYTRQTLMDTALQAGLSIERILYIDTMGAIATMIYKLLERLRPGDSYNPPSALALRVYDNAIWPLSRLVDSLMRHSFGKNLLLFSSRR